MSSDVLDRCDALLQRLELEGLSSYVGTTPCVVMLSSTQVCDTSRNVNMLADLGNDAGVIMHNDLNSCRALKPQ